MAVVLHGWACSVHTVASAETFSCEFPHLRRSVLKLDQNDGIKTMKSFGFRQSRARASYSRMKTPETSRQFCAYFESIRRILLLLNLQINFNFWNYKYQSETINLLSMESDQTPFIGPVWEIRSFFLSRPFQRFSSGIESFGGGPQNDSGKKQAAPLKSVQRTSNRSKTLKSSKWLPLSFFSDCPDCFWNQ